jgi:FixJ family two-component response regulator
MLIVLKQDNKEIAELLAIAPRSVLMLRHRFRQKIGLPADQSLESFIESTLEFQNSLNEETTFHSDLEEDDSSL